MSVRLLWARAAMVAAFGLSGCVVVDERPSRALSDRAAASPLRVDRSAAMPDGPVASPALAARTVHSRVVAGVTPVGTVPYDGQVLPLVSPDGRYVATQHGEAPSWAALVGAPGAAPPVRTRLAAYEVVGGGARRLPWRERPPVGSMLGRGVDARGFLIEWIGPEGDRRIGRVAWRTGETTWLTPAGEHAAHGALDHASALRWSRFDAGSGWSVVGGGAGARAASASVFPTPIGVGAGAMLGVFVLSGEGTEVQLRGPSGEASAIIARRWLGGASSLAAVYQSVDGGRGRRPVDGEPGLMITDASAGRMLVLDPRTGDLLPMAPGSIAGVWARDSAGWAALLTTPGGLVHQRLIDDGGVLEALPASRLLSDVFVPRATPDGESPYMLIGPGGRRSPGRVSLVRLDLLPAEGAPVSSAAPVGR